MSGIRQAHWDQAYAGKGEAGLSWFEANPVQSLDLIATAGAGPGDAVIDIGGGASRLVDALLERGFTDLTVLDISPAALATARTRLGAASEGVTWIAADVTRWQPARTYDLWHDRATFHFLTEADDRAAYLARLAAALRPGGHAIIASFAPDGPERCSGLPVRRYDAGSLGATLGDRFERVATRRHVHVTPWGAGQSFQYHLFRRVS